MMEMMIAERDRFLVVGRSQHLLMKCGALLWHGVLSIMWTEFKYRYNGYAVRLID